VDVTGGDPKLSKVIRVLRGASSGSRRAMGDPPNDSAGSLFLALMDRTGSYFSLERALQGVSKTAPL